ncbi:hypothetical protein ACMXYW_04685 [Neptuniibacter sp. QD48_55]|uniref:hypothetical protein n=1 Tax=Neptuniibacter sp. QD48_55 TaxID=3398212 RepID=UPI0039F472A7
MSLDKSYLRMFFEPTEDTGQGCKQDRNNDAPNSIDRTSLLQISLSYGLPADEIARDLGFYAELESMQARSINELIKKHEKLYDIENRLLSHQPNILTDVKRAISNDDSITLPPVNPKKKLAIKTNSHPLKKLVFDISTKYFEDHGKLPDFKTLMRKLKTAQHDMAYSELCLEITDEYIEYANPVTGKLCAQRKPKSLQNRYSEWRKELLTLLDSSSNPKSHIKH